MPLTYYATTDPQNEMPNSVGQSFSFGLAAQAANMASGNAALLPTNGVLHLLPFYVQTRSVAQQLWWINGALPLTGAVRMGIYDDTYTLLVSGSASVSGSNQTQTIDITDTTLQRGTYYLAWLLSSSLGTNKHAALSTNPASWPRIFGCVQLTGQTSLPSTFTRAGNGYAQTVMPLCGVAYRSFI